MVLATDVASIQITHAVHLEWTSIAEIHRADMDAVANQPP